MGFKKLDSAAVLSSSSRPVDAFILQQEADNLATAHSARGRGISGTYAAPSVGLLDTLPVIASPWNSALPVAVWPVSAGCTQLELRINGTATAAIGETDAVFVRLALQTVAGQFVMSDTSTTIVGSVSEQTITLQLDVRAYQQQTVVVWLCFESQPITSAAPSGTHNGSHIDVDGTRFNLNHISFTYDAAKRYRLRFSEDPTGSAPREQFGYCGVRMIQDHFSGNKYDIIPALPEYMESYSHFLVTLEEIGRMQVLGWALTETQFADLPDITDRFRPAGRLRAGAAQQLYQRAYALHSNRTRIYNGTATRRASGWQQWLLKFEPQTALLQPDIYVCCVGDLPQYKVHTDSSAPAAQYRRRYRILAAYALATSAPANFRVSATVELSTFAAGAWSTDVVTPTMQQEVQTAPAVVYDTRGQITALSLRNMANMNYFAWSVGDLLQGTSGMRLLDIQFEEDAAQQTVAARLLRVGLTVLDETGTQAPLLAPVIALPGCCVMISEGM